MLEAGINQGIGLRALAALAAPRVVAMASHGNRLSESPLLWNLCAAWSDLGYQVAVIDATVAESDKHPGLLQLLDNAGPSGKVDGDFATWPVIPAALGLEQLCRAVTQDECRMPPLQHLASLFQNYEIVLVYADAKNLASCLPDSGLEPLLAVSANRMGMSILTAYQALKQLLIIGRLQPTIVAVMDKSDQATMVYAHSMSKSLQDCAKAFLGHQVTALTIGAQLSDGQTPDDVNRLALRLLESAVPLCPNATTEACFCDMDMFSNVPFARSH